MSGLPRDPESVIAWAARAYVVGLVRRESFEDVVRFALECERDGSGVGWPWGIPLPYQIKDAEEANQRRLSSVRRSRRALRRTLKEAILA